MSLLTVQHTTVYRYRQPVPFGPHYILARPQAWPDQTILAFTLDVTPEPASIGWTRDLFGNWLGCVRFRQTAAELRFKSKLRVRQRFHKAAAATVSPHGDTVQKYSTRELAALTPYLMRQSADREDRVAGWARDMAALTVGRDPLNVLRGMNGALRRFRYVRRTGHGTQPPHVTLDLRSGSCRDLAMLLIDAVRSLGFAARFVSGYVHVPVGNGETLLGDGSTHGWAQIFVPGVGWLDCDPTNGIVGNHGLVRVAVAQRPDQVAPLYGTWTGSAADSLGMTVAVTVTADETPAEPRRASTFQPPVAAPAMAG